MIRRRKLSTWQRLTSFPQPFSFEVDVPLEDVVQNLADLEQEHRLFRRDSQDVSVLPRRDHYVFRVKRRRHGSPAALVEGDVWENEAGHVVVEGEARSNGGPMIIILIVLLIPMIHFTMTFRQAFGFIPLLIFFAAVILDFMLLNRDRQAMITQIGEAIRRINGASQETHKAKRQPGARLALVDDTLPDLTNWDQLVDELENRQQGPSGQ